MLATFSRQCCGWNKTPCTVVAVLVWISGLGTGFDTDNSLVVMSRGLNDITHRAEKCRPRFSGSTAIAEACEHLGAGSSLRLQDTGSACEQLAGEGCAVFDNSGLCNWTELIQVSPPCCSASPGWRSRRLSHSAPWTQSRAEECGPYWPQTLTACRASRRTLIRQWGRAGTTPWFRVSAFVVPITKVLCENDLQTWLRGSGFGLSFDAVSEMAKLKMLASLSVGLLSATTKSCQGLWNTKPVFKEAYEMACLPSVGNLLSLFIVTWVFCKLYFAFHCDSHLWNFGNGCVRFDAI
mmetsp:Transcript_22394/g.42853  ORF Transcript_22394/g.42853 Transcript_22394/m.42853 type:complete len:294 (-) Transcript_22394:19-900(-)